MNELEQAATALLEHAPATPALDAIERRAHAIRRRRRLGTGAIALAVAVLVAGVVVGLAAARGGDEQSVYVGPDPTASSGDVRTYPLAAPVDPDVAIELQHAVQARLALTGAQVRLTPENDAVIVTGGREGVPIDRLVTTPGGFELRTIAGQLAPEACDAPDHEAMGAAWSSALTGPPACYQLGSALPLPSPASTSWGFGDAPDGTYVVYLTLTSAAGAVVLDSGHTCVTTTGDDCRTDTLALVSGGVVLDPAAHWTIRADPSQVELRLTGIATYDEATVWSQVFPNPLPDGVAFAS